MSITQSFSQLYEYLHGEAPPIAITQRESDASILSPGRGFMADFDWTMQLQIGCPAGCQFCYVARGFRLAPSDVQRNWGFEVRYKRSVVSKLRRHIDSGDLADKTIYWSGVTDPYVAAPTATREVWETFCASPAELRPRRVVVQTRFRADRDAALMRNYCETTRPADLGPPVVVSYSVGTDRDDLIRAWERATPMFESRLSAIEALGAAGIFVVSTLSPFALWNDLTGALKRFQALGVSYITVLFFKENTTAANTPKPFLNYLCENCPELLDAKWQTDRIAEMESVYGARRVLVGQPGFASLAAPQAVAQITSSAHPQTNVNSQDCAQHYRCFPDY